ncbi:hypothetical protein V6N12_073381 [Hibiscus sabdariffa]|uniref:Uncharacterized protein n=1 Tax=Hibiscus sabdariffa TaxID=183260 RepID=A0ABR2BUK4_9ROSI
MYTAKEVKKQVDEAKKDVKQLQEAQSQRDLSQQMTQQINEQKVWLQQRLAELEETYQDTVARLNSANLLLDVDEREIVDTLRHAGEWI